MRREPNQPEKGVYGGNYSTGRKTETGGSREPSIELEMKGVKLLNKTKKTLFRRAAQKTTRKKKGGGFQPILQEGSGEAGTEKNGDRNQGL